MTLQSIYTAISGGALIGLAVSLMLFINGKIAGVSGIANNTFVTPKANDWLWRFTFILGLFTGGVLLNLNYSEVFNFSNEFRPWLIIIAGFLVGFGTVMGNGCTSGHGIAGLSRLSPRSIAATLTFMATGVLTVFVMKWIGG